MRSSFWSKLRRFSSETRGAAALIFALAAVPVFFMLGASIDYARAAKTRAQLTAIADAAALSATTPNMLAQNASVAQTMATNMFAAQAANVVGVSYDPSKLTVTVVDAPNASGANVRNATVSYNARFASLLPVLDWATQANFVVTATVNTQAGSNSPQPNIDFYVLADNSPSMELPATSAGIATMQANTGCALACHESDYTEPSYSSQYPGWGSTDSYTYAQNAGIALRIDSVRQAVQALANSAPSVATTNSANYQMAVYSFNDHVSLIHGLSPASAANAAMIQSDVASLTPPLMQAQNTLPIGYSYVYPTGATTNSTAILTSTVGNDDAMTNMSLALNSINAIIPNPGNGTNQPGDTPQKVLVLITDGVDDAAVYNSSFCTTTNTGSISNSYGNFTRCMQPIDTSVCASIKNRGIRIAVLYVKYYPLPSDTFYVANIAPNIAQIPTNLQNCASGPNLFFQVDTDGDFSASLFQTFMAAVGTAPHLTH